MWKLFFLFPAFITCTIILNKCYALPDEPPAPVNDFPTSTNTGNFPSIPTVSVSPTATTYPATATSSESLFPNADASANSFQFANSFSPLPDFAPLIPNSSFASATSASAASATSDSDTSATSGSDASATSGSDASATSALAISLPGIDTGTSCAESDPASLPTDEPPSDTSSLNAFAKAVLSLPSIQQYLYIQISGKEASILLYKLSHKVLIDYANPQPDMSADEISQAAAKIQTLTLPIYFQAMGNAIYDFYQLKGLEVTPDLPIFYSGIVNYYVTSSNVNDTESLYKSFSDSFVKFITLEGFFLQSEADILAHYFSRELLIAGQQ